MSRFTKHIFRFIIAGIFIPLSLHAQPADEYTIKAVWLERFTRFIDWPKNNRVNDQRKNFTIGIVGDDPFCGKLEQVYNDQRIKNKHVTVLRLESYADIEKCDLLFISSSEADQLVNILAKTWNKAILTISDTPGFGQKGVLINFYWDLEKIRFEINEKAVNDSGLYFGFRLMNAATLINRINP